MSEKGRKSEDFRNPHHVRLPGFVNEEEVGLGDAIKRVTFAMGINPCTGCERRAATLNHLLMFTGRGRSINGGR